MKNKQGLLYVALVCIVVVACGIGLYFLSNQPKKSGSGPEKRPLTVNEPSIHKGVMRLVPKDGRSVYTSGEEIPFLLYIDSAGQDIGGYDVVIPTGDTGMTYVRSVSLRDDLEIHPNVAQEGILSLSGISVTIGQSGIILQDEPVAEVVMQKAGEGVAHVNLLFTDGETSDSNIVHMATADDLLARVESPTVYVGKKIPLKPQMRTPIGDGTVVVLESVSIPNATCNDCISEARVVVTQGGVDETLSFKLGGIGGSMISSAQAFGLLFEVAGIRAQGIDLYVTRGE